MRPETLFIWRQLEIERLPIRGVLILRAYDYDVNFFLPQSISLLHGISRFPTLTVYTFCPLSWRQEEMIEHSDNLYQKRTPPRHPLFLSQTVSRFDFVYVDGTGTSSYEGICTKPPKKCRIGSERSNKNCRKRIHSLII